MENAESLDRLFFVLASDSRLNILRELQAGNLKMQDIARRLDLTATEAFRQLERLSAALLVQRQPDGTYALTQYSKLELHLSSSMEFVLRHKQYFLTHDVWRLPLQFVNRIGELSKATLKMGLIESTFKSSQLIGEARNTCGESHLNLSLSPLTPLLNRSQRGWNTGFFLPSHP